MAKAKKPVKKQTQKMTKPAKKATAKAKPVAKMTKATKKAAPKKSNAKKVTKKGALKAQSAQKSTANKKTTTPKTNAKAMAVKPTARPAAKSNIDYSKVVTPLGDRLVVRLASAEKTTSGGLIIPDTVATVEGHLKGEVLAVGQGAKNKKGQVRPLDVQKGDQILFSAYAGTKVQFGTEDLHIVHESDVLGIVQK